MNNIIRADERMVYQRSLGQEVALTVLRGKRIRRGKIRWRGSCGECEGGGPRDRERAKEHEKAKEYNRAHK